jgi:2'-5' RNA ligase
MFGGATRLKRLSSIASLVITCMRHGAQPPGMHLTLHFTGNFHRSNADSLAYHGRCERLTNTLKYGLVSQVGVLYDSDVPELVL